MNVTYCEPRSAELFFLYQLVLFYAHLTASLLYMDCMLSVKSYFHETLATEKSRPQIIRVVAAEYFPAGQLIVSASCAVPINLPYIQSGN